MSRRKQRFPLHLKNEQPGEEEEEEEEEGEEIGGMEDMEEQEEEESVHSRSEEQEIRYTVTTTTTAETERVPANGEMVVGVVVAGDLSHTFPPHSTTSNSTTVKCSAKIEECVLEGDLNSAIFVTGSANSKQEEEEEEEKREVECKIMTDSVEEEEDFKTRVIERKRRRDMEEEEEEGEEEEESKKRRESVQEECYRCPVCQEGFKSKRSFNTHILVHCQLVNGALVGGKRGAPDYNHQPSAHHNRKRAKENNVDDRIRRYRVEEEDEEEQEEEERTGGGVIKEEEESGVPLDLSCRSGSGGVDVERPAASSTPEYSKGTPPLSTPLHLAPWRSLSHSTANTYPAGPPDRHSTRLKDSPPLPATPQLYPSTQHLSVHSHNLSTHSDRSPLEDETENLVNEAREKEKAFLDMAQNEQYLTEDSTGLDPPPPLPLYGAGGAVRRVRVGGDEGPPMVYTVRLHAEQVLVSRILGINDETGDKMELYKCFMCCVAFPSVSRLQAHLWTHKQRFVCSKCSFSCDSRVVFSSHVQREHLSTAVPPSASAAARREGMDGHRGSAGQPLEDPSSAENTVTVAALLSALREKARGGGGAGGGMSPAPPHTDEEEMDEENGSSGEDSYPISPGCEGGAGQETPGSGNGAGEEIFKMYTCRFCGKKFDRAFSCNRHERVHTGYKPCFCRVCGRGFSEPRNLRHHVIRFHSDGSLRHLIKRDRRRKAEDDAATPSPHSPPSPPLAPLLAPQPPPRAPEARFKDVLKETANKLISSSNIDLSGLSGKTSGLEITLASKPVGQDGARGNRASPVGCSSPSPPPTPVAPSAITSTAPGEVNAPAAAAAAAAAAVAVTTYTTSLTKIIAASLDNSTRGTSRRISGLTVEAGVGPGTFRGQELEPGEIRLDRRARIIDDGESGRRLVVAEDEDGLDHSPHFSNYAPRLNIVQEPIDRDKALVPITDDIGRTFFECPYCHKLFGSTSDMNRHLDFHEDLRPYNCEYCDYSARTNSQLKVHKMRHEGIKLYSCDVCNYNGVTQSDLNRHKKTQSHIARSQNICSICGLGFYTGSQKQVHIVQCHPEVEGASSLIQMSMGPPVAPLLPPPPPPQATTTTTTTAEYPTTPPTHTPTPTAAL